MDKDGQPIGSTHAVFTQYFLRDLSHIFANGNGNTTNRKIEMLPVINGLPSDGYKMFNKLMILNAAIDNDQKHQRKEFAS